jgi:hypothetical protein
MANQPAIATAFEAEVRRLGLDMQACTSSTKLRLWCERNKNQHYIPEWLLERWGISVDANASIDTRVRAA